METQHTPGRMTVIRLPRGRTWLAEATTGDPGVILFFARRTRLAIEHSQGSYLLGDGDLVVVRGRGQIAVRTDGGGDAIAVRITRTAAGPHFAQLVAGSGRLIGSKAGTASIVAHLLDGIIRQADDHDTSYHGRLAQHVAGLVALVCMPTGNHVDDRLQQIKDYVEAHLADIELTPARVARAQNISIRTLHRLFEEEHQTLSRWIRDRRLEECRLEILASGRDVPISTIANRWGMWDAARFSRSFKTAYGMPPRTYRDAHLETSPARLPVLTRLENAR